MWVIKSFNLFALTKNASGQLKITKRFLKLTTLFQIGISTVFSTVDSFLNPGVLVVCNSLGKSDKPKCQQQQKLVFSFRFQFNVIQ